MEFQKTTGRIWLEDETGREIAYVAFPARTPDTVVIRSTFVDASLRGQGVAGALMEELTRQLRATGQRAVPVCSYAVRWFEQHPDQSDLVVQE